MCYLFRYLSDYYPLHILMIFTTICYFFATLLVNSHSYFVLNVRVCGAVNDRVVGCVS